MTGRVEPAITGPRGRASTTARNVMLLSEAEAAIAALASAGIPVLVVKGAALLGAVYHLEERAMEDVDLLVPHDRGATASAALARAGFSRGGDPRRPLASRRHHACAFWRDPMLRIDLHSRLAYPPRWQLDGAGLFSRAVTWAAAPDGWARRLSDEDLLVHLAVSEAAGELTGDGRASLDAQRVIDRLCPNWEALVARARESRSVIASWLLLRHARMHRGVEIPAWVEDALRPDPLRASLLHRLLRLDQATPYRFTNHPRRLRQALVAPLVTDSPLLLAGAAARFAALRTADLALRIR